MIANAKGALTSCAQHLNQIEVRQIHFIFVTKIGCKIDNKRRLTQISAKKKFSNS